MMAVTAPPDRQPCLFEALPATEPRRRRRRARPAAAAGEETPAAAAVPTFAEPPPPPYRPPPVAVKVDAASLSRPDLSDLVRDLAEPSLGFLLLEAAREAKRRLVPDDPEESELTPEPSPQLLRAIRSVVAELAEEE